MKFIFGIIFSFYLSFQGYTQTCVIGKIEDGNIYIGADSRQTRLNVFGNRIDSIPIITCKIHTIKNFGFVNIGNLVDEAYEIATNICLKSDLFDSVVLKYSKLFREAALRKLEGYKVHSPVLYSKLITDSILSQIAFFGYENDSLVFCSYIFSAKQRQNGEIVVYSRFTPALGGYLAGEIKEIDSLYMEPDTWKNGIVEGIDTLISIAAKHNKTVALPVDIIKVTKRNFIWIRRKNTCSM